MEPESSLPLSQVPASCSYPEPDLSSPCPFFPSGFPTKTLYTTLLSPIRVTCPLHRILLDLITRKILGEQYGSLSCSLCSFLHSRVASSLLGPNILLGTLFSNTQRLLSSLNVSDHVSHPYKTGNGISRIKLGKNTEGPIRLYRA